MARSPTFLAGLLAAAFLLSACSAAGVLNAVTDRSGFEIVRDVRYGEGPRGTFDLYVPDGASAQTPLVVFIYGGNWDSGSKDTYFFVGQSLAKSGVIAAIPNYRIYPETLFPGFVEDAAQATAAIRRAVVAGDYGIPAGPHPLVLMGHSAGAQIAALLVYDGRYLAAEGVAAGQVAGFVGLSGPYDFLPLNEERYRRIFPQPLRDASQPVNFVDGNEAPALLVTGLDDTTVDPDNTRSLARRIEAAGGSVRASFYPDVDHVGAITSFATALPLGERGIREAVLAFIRERAGS